MCSQTEAPIALPSGTQYSAYLDDSTDYISRPHSPALDQDESAAGPLVDYSGIESFEDGIDPFDGPLWYDALNAEAVAREAGFVARAPVAPGQAGVGKSDGDDFAEPDGQAYEVDMTPSGNSLHSSEAWERRASVIKLKFENYMVAVKELDANADSKTPASTDGSIRLRSGSCRLDGQPKMAPVAEIGSYCIY